MNARVAVWHRFAMSALLIVTLTSLVGCKADSNYFATSNSSVGSGDGTTSDAAAGFRIRIKAKTGVANLLHKFGDVTAACEIPLASVGTPTEIQCLNNMMEYDLWFYGFEYELNVPKGSCDYLTVTPNYHYQAQPGRGPSTGRLTKVDGTITGCLIDGVAGTIADGVCSGPEGYIKSDGTLVCEYDYSKKYKVPGFTVPNCCVGSAKVVVVSTVNDPLGQTITTTAVDTDYGGAYSNCMQSPHDYIDTWPKMVSKNAATLIVELGQRADVRTQRIPSTQSLFMASKRPGSHSNFLNAGFYDWATYVADPATWVTARTIPRAFAPLYDRGPLDDHLSGSGATATGTIGDGSEDFRCIGPAGEVKLRIRMFTNEWNTVEAYQAYAKLDGTGGTTAAGADPTVRGTVPANCSAVNVGPSCNTIWGFEDMLNEAGGGLSAYEFPEEYIRGSPP